MRDRHLEKLKGLDKDKLIIRLKHLTHILDAHKIPEEKETMFALLFLAISEFVDEYGPRAMGDIVALFIDVWRHCEATSVLKSITDEALKQKLAEFVAEKVH